MSGPGGRGAWIVLIVAAIAGCGGSDDGGNGVPAEASRPSASRPVVFVGFDASEPLVDAMRQGKIQGLVVQNPLKMGELSVKTMVKHLEKQPVETQISTGETAGHAREHERSRDRQADSSPAGREHERGEPLGRESRRSGG